MTQMSDPHRQIACLNEHNCSRSQACAPLARPVHGSGRLVYFALLAALVVGGCVIPPNLSVEDQDAGVNSPPAITLVSSDEKALPEPGPVVFVRGMGSLNLELLDTDLADTLFVRVFVNYDPLMNPSPPRSTCTAAPSGAAKRTLTCDLTALCLMGDSTKTDLVMSVVVFDRQPLENGDPPFQQMPDGGLSTGRFYFLMCQEPQV